MEGCGHEIGKANETIRASMHSSDRDNDFGAAGISHPAIALTLLYLTSYVAV